MLDLGWQRTLEQVALRNRRYRLLGFTSLARSAGVSLVSRLIAKALAGSGCKTLLVDLSDAATADWDGKPVSSTAFRNAIVTTTHGFDLLSGTTEECARHFSNVTALRDFLQRDIPEYDNVVLDMPSILDNDGRWLSTVSTSAICNAMFLVCVVGKDRKSDIAEVAGLLKGAGTTLAGVISNEGVHRDPLPAILTRFLPTVSARTSFSETTAQTTRNE